MRIFGILWIPRVWKTHTTTAHRLCVCHPGGAVVMNACPVGPYVPKGYFLGIIFHQNDWFDIWDAPKQGSVVDYCCYYRNAIISSLKWVWRGGLQSNWLMRSVQEVVFQTWRARKCIGIIFLRFFPGDTKWWDFSVDIGMRPDQYVVVIHTVMEITFSSWISRKLIVIYAFVCLTHTFYMTNGQDEEILNFKWKYWIENTMQPRL